VEESKKLIARHLPVRKQLSHAVDGKLLRSVWTELLPAKPQLLQLVARHLDDPQLHDKFFRPYSRTLIAMASARRRQAKCATKKQAGKAGEGAIGHSWSLEELGACGSRRV